LQQIAGNNGGFNGNFHYGADTMGAPMGPPRTTAAGVERNAMANEMVVQLPASSEYREVSAQEAQQLGNEGKFVIAAQPPAGPHGHVTTVRPANTYFEQGFQRDGSGPLQNHVGRTVGIVGGRNRSTVLGGVQDLLHAVKDF
jgi:hypothetical protein